MGRDRNPEIGSCHSSRDFVPVSHVCEGKVISQARAEITRKIKWFGGVGGKYLVCKCNVIV